MGQLLCRGFTWHIFDNNAQKYELSNVQRALIWKLFISVSSDLQSATMYNLGSDLKLCKGTGLHFPDNKVVLSKWIIKQIYENIFSSKYMNK